MEIKEALEQTLQLLTPELWRPFSVHTQHAEYDGKRGCLLQLVHYLHSNHVAEEVRVVWVLERTLRAMGERVSIGKFNDTHSLEDVRRLVERAITQV
jgi:hypothetical protein